MQSDWPGGPRLPDALSAALANKLTNTDNWQTQYFSPGALNFMQPDHDAGSGLSADPMCAPCPAARTHSIGGVIWRCICEFAAVSSPTDAASAAGSFPTRRPLRGTVAPTLAKSHTAARHAARVFCKRGAYVCRLPLGSADSCSWPHRHRRCHSFSYAGGCAFILSRART